MKRYNPIVHIEGWNVAQSVEEDTYGDYVKWEDVENLLNNLGHNASITGLHERVKRLEELKEPMCNCVEMAQTTKFSQPSTLIDSWVCPVHGYTKR